MVSITDRLLGSGYHPESKSLPATELIEFVDSVVGAVQQRSFEKERTLFQSLSGTTHFLLMMSAMIATAASVNSKLIFPSI